MNRIRKKNNIYQVLITPELKLAPDGAALLIGNWGDEHLRNYYVLEFESLNDAQCESLNHPDINWYRIVLNHQHIYKRLDMTLRQILSDQNIEFRSTLLDPESFKNIIFDRVLQAGEKFNLRNGMNDIISFIIINPWSSNLYYISKLLENYRAHLYNDDLRLRQKIIIDDKIILLTGYTELGTMYEIKLIPTLLQQWADNYNKNSYRDPKQSIKIYEKILQQQKNLDNGIIIK